MRFNEKRLFLLLVAASFLLSGASARFSASAQQRQQPQSRCPVTRVSCPDMVIVGEKLTFTANVSGGDPNVTPTYNWTVSAGTIESGQGTPTIEVNTNELAPDSSVTATVDLGGFDRECGYGAVSSSCTTTVAKKAESRKLDEYSTLAPKAEGTRLDNFTVELQSDPQAQGYILAYGGRASRAGDARKAADRARDYLVNKRGLQSERIVVVDGGYRERPAVELWLVPSGAQPPQPAPTVKPGEVKPAGPARPAKPKTARSRKT
jgi:hypothetical protein